MSYTAWSVTYLELPTTAKWNQLGENDAGFNDGTNIDAAAIKKSHLNFDDGIYWEELGRATLSGAADVMTVSSFTAKKFLKVFVFIQNSGSVSGLMTFNNVTTSTYASRQASNGGAEGSTASATSITIIGAASRPTWAVHDIINLATIEKMVTGFRVDIPTAGAATAPNRQEQVAKWANTTDQITRIDITNGSTGDFTTGSEVIVLGHD